MGANVLSCMLQKANKANLIQGVRASKNAPKINHLLFADDLILFIKVNKSTYQAIQDIFNQFEEMSGLTINREKSEIWFGPNTPKQPRKEYVDQLGLRMVRKFGKYLGTYVDEPTRRMDIGKELIDKVSKKLQGWKSRLLSQARRLTLCNSVLQNLSTYQMATSKIPKTHLKQIETCVRDFWWGNTSDQGKMHLIKWEHLARPIKQGGLDYVKWNLLIRPC